MNHLVIHDEPLKVLLKDTISETITKAVDDSVKARFGGVRLPTAIKDSHEVITKGGDVVAVKINERFTVAVNYFSVARSPVFAVGDGVVHLLFNLTHVVKKGVNLFDSFNIEHRGELQPTLCHFAHWSANIASWASSKVDDLISCRACEAVTEPVEAHLSRPLSVDHE